MKATGGETRELFLALALLLGAAHSIGYVFAKWRQPRVIGEIAGGLLLGPTVLGMAMPGVQGALFGDHGSSSGMLKVFAQLGLVFLMFSAGADVRPELEASEKRTAGLVAAGSLFLPFALGTFLPSLFGLERLQGPHGDGGQVAMVLGMAVSVTSIPVLTRILVDLKLGDTSFARIVLSAGFAKDLVLYAVLSVVVAHANPEEQRGRLSQLLGISAKGGSQYLEYLLHAMVTLGLIALSVAFGRRGLRRIAASPWFPVGRGSSVGAVVVFVALVAALGDFLGVSLMFGAMAAGLAVREALDAATVGPAGDDFAKKLRQGKDEVKGFATAFFVPIYFALVGTRLDLVHHLDVSMFLGILGVATLLQVACVYGVTRWRGMGETRSRDVAMAMNARGAPCILLASVTRDAGIIGPELHVVLILLALVTSAMAGAWLKRSVDIAGGVEFFEIAKNRMPSGDESSPRKHAALAA